MAVDAHATKEGFPQRSQQAVPVERDAVDGEDSANTVPPRLPPCEDTLIWDVFLSAFTYPTVTVADEMGLFPLMAKSAATTEELAAKLSIGPRSTEALLGILTALRLLKKESGQFQLTELARSYLLPDSPFYWGPMLHIHWQAG